jgi:hypothetical protein
VTDVSNRIVQKLWSYCNVLHDDRLSYRDCPEQLTFLLFRFNRRTSQRRGMLFLPRPGPSCRLCAMGVLDGGDVLASGGVGAV